MISAPRDLIIYVGHAMKYSNKYAPIPKKTVIGGGLKTVFLIDCSTKVLIIAWPDLGLDPV